MATAARGCGVREPGGVYLETRVDPIRGLPIERFLIDPAIRVPEEMHLPNRGVAILRRHESDPTCDVYDRVGTASYPNVTDFIEETKRLGLSRRIPANANFALLSDKSEIRLAHPRALIENAVLLYGHLAQEKQAYVNHPAWRCICGREDHATLANLVILSCPTCASCWYETVTGGDPTWNPDHFPRTVERKIGSIPYIARSTPYDYVPVFADAFFLRLPLHRIVVIRDPEEHRDEEAFARASIAVGLPVILEDA